MGTADLRNEGWRALNRSDPSVGTANGLGSAFALMKVRALPLPLPCSPLPCPAVKVGPRSARAQ